MDKFSLEAALLNDKYNAEEAEMIAEEWERQFGDDPDFQD